MTDYFDVILLITMAYLMAGTLIAVSYDYCKDDNPDDRIPWIDYDWHPMVIVLLWLPAVIFLPLMHGLWVLFNDEEDG